MRGWIIKSNIYVNIIIYPYPKLSAILANLSIKEIPGKKKEINLTVLWM